MKRQFRKNWLRGPHSLKFDLLITLVALLLWVAATYSRSWVIQPKCGSAPQTCSKESVLPFDRLSLGMENSSADEYSYFTQNFSGVLAVSVPTLWNLSQFALGRLTPSSAIATLGIDLLIILQTTSWNGLFTEISHLLAQRPRPFVYMDPATRGIDPAHYTSFYSGHTSFTAAVNFILFLILWARGAPLVLLVFYAATLEGLVFSTAYFRILAGRHFLTDVIFGAFAGSLVACVVYWKHRYRLNRKSTSPVLE